MSNHSRTQPSPDAIGRRTRDVLEAQIDEEKPLPPLPLQPRPRPSPYVSDYIPRTIPRRPVPSSSRVQTGRVQQGQVLPASLRIASQRSLNQSVANTAVHASIHDMESNYVSQHRLRREVRPITPHHGLVFSNSRISPVMDETSQEEEYEGYDDILESYASSSSMGSRSVSPLSVTDSPSIDRIERLDTAQRVDMPERLDVPPTAPIQGPEYRPHSSSSFNSSYPPTHGSYSALSLTEREDQDLSFLKPPPLRIRPRRQENESALQPGSGSGSLDGWSREHFGSSVEARPISARTVSPSHHIRGDETFLLAGRTVPEQRPLGVPPIRVVNEQGEMSFLEIEQTTSPPPIREEFETIPLTDPAAPKVLEPDTVVRVALCDDQGESFLEAGRLHPLPQTVRKFRHDRRGRVQQLQQEDRIQQHEIIRGNPATGIAPYRGFYRPDYCDWECCECKKHNDKDTTVCIPEGYTFPFQRTCKHRRCKGCRDLPPGTVKKEQERKQKEEEKKEQKKKEEKESKKPWAWF